MPRVIWMKKRTVSISIYFKISLALILLMVVFSSIIIISSTVSTNRIKAGLEDAEISKLGYFSERLEDEIVRIMEILKEYVNDPDIQMLSKAADGMSIYTQQKAMLDIVKKFSLLQSSSEFIENVSIDIPMVGKSISGTWGVNPIDMDEFTKLSQYNSFKTMPVIQYEGNFYISMVYPATYGEETKPVAYNMLVQLSLEDIKTYLTNISGDSNGGVVLYNTIDQWNIVQDASDTGAVPARLLSYYGEGDLSGIPKTLKVGDEKYMIFKVSSEYLKMDFIDYIPQGILYKAISGYTTMVVWVLLPTILAMLAISYWIFNMFKVPLDRLLHAFKVLETGSMDVSIVEKSGNEFSYLYSQFNNMVVKLKSLIHDVFEEKIRRKNAVLKQLQYQINPHFLYNSFNIIYRMAKIDDTENIAEFVYLLGNYYQYINCSSSSEIDLKEEIEHCENFMRIQAIHYKNRIKMHLNYDKSKIKNVRVPYLILQPIVENAFEYGLTKVQNGEIRIDIDMPPEFIIITVEDNGKGMTTDDMDKLREKLDLYQFSENSSGIVNVHKRLKLKYGNECGISIAKSENLGGLRVSIKIRYGG